LGGHRSMTAQRWMLGAGVVAIAVAMTWFWFASGGAREGDSLPKRAAIAVEQTPRSTNEPTNEDRGETATLRSSATEVEAATAAVEEPAQVDATASLRWVEGRVLDPRGEPLVGVEVVGARLPARNELDAVLAQSDGSGRFRFETDAEELVLYGRRPGFVTVYSALVDEATSDEVRIVLAPSVHLEGRVVDSDGRGIEHAVLQVARDAPWLVGFPFPLDGNAREFAPSRSIADGSFTYRPAPLIDGFDLRVQAVGFERTWIEVPDAPQYDLLITLERAEPTDKQTARIFGVVVLPDGRPATGAS